MSNLYLSYKLKDFLQKHKVKLVAMGMIGFIIFFESFKKIEKQEYSNLNTDISSENNYEKRDELTENELNFKNRIESKIDKIETLKDDVNNEYIIYEHYSVLKNVKDENGKIIDRYEEIIDEYQSYTISFDLADRLGINDLLDSKMINTKKIS